MQTFQRIIIGVLGVLLLVVVVQSILPENYEPEEQVPVTEAPCEGQPLNVDYAFEGGYLDPWACQPQCDDGIQRYVVYSNGKATQCETPPGCNDWGEDRGVTCTLPEQTPAS